MSLHIDALAWREREKRQPSPCTKLYLEVYDVYEHCMYICIYWLAWFFFLYLKRETHSEYTYVCVQSRFNRLSLYIYWTVHTLYVYFMVVDTQTLGSLWLVNLLRAWIVSFPAIHADIRRSSSLEHIQSLCEHVFIYETFFFFYSFYTLCVSASIQKQWLFSLYHIESMCIVDVICVCEYIESKL